jgi:hypothetical protein
MSIDRHGVLRKHRRWVTSATLGVLVAGLGSWGCSVDAEPEAAVDAEPEATGAVASPLPVCEEGSTAPICNPGEPACKPRCKMCGGADGCGGICRTGVCPFAGDTCGGAGVPAQCGHRGVDLRSQQTGFRNQGARDLCTVFATTAAVEAAYKRRYGLELDLSEQYFNHVQKSYWLNWNAQLPAAEIQPETNGGGNIPWQLSVLTRYGLPPESSLPYIDAASWQAVTGWTSHDGNRILTNQRALDDFMLSASPVTYMTPSPITATVLPQAALEGARYRPTSTKLAVGADLTNLAWFKAELAAGREIAFDVSLTGPDPTPNDGVWDPGPMPLGTHAMLMVGYDDVKQAFWVKNQWGTGAFDLFSYGWVTGGRVLTAATILDVADPYTPFGTFENNQLTLGRWNLDFDGWRGELDIYRLPGDGSPPAPDRRIGTYFGPDGVARRVNGTISGNRLDFYVDWNNPNLAFTALQGMHFTTYVYGAEKTAMAGMMTNTDGSRWEVTAQKGQWLTGVPRSPGVLAPSAYSGRWSLDTDGTKGNLAISANTAGTISGTFTTLGGAVFNVVGAVTADPRIFTFLIQDAPQWSVYSGYLNGHALGLMAGVASKSGVPVGFHATRTGEL